MDSVTEEVDVQFYLILISLHLNSRPRLMALFLESPALAHLLVFDSCPVHMTVDPGARLGSGRTEPPGFSWVRPEGRSGVVIMDTGLPQTLSKVGLVSLINCLINQLLIND